MRIVYRVLGYLIAALVAVQAAAVAYGFFSLGKYIEGGGSIDQAAMNNPNFTFPGVEGLAVHGMFGTMVVPGVALLFLIVGIITQVTTKIRGALLWSVITLVVTVVQVALGLGAHSVPQLGMLHGIVALGLFAVAFMAAHRIGRASAPTTVEAAPARSAEPVAG
ncbi:hypothetical protein FHX74_001448 [Friedmanniella endophytica]|uniref:Cytochrome c oxidase assembly protein subunit 15 n=1 Tax=Microlunatus kandeliicorticis TaxID=1759536 RepID=A0A7W3P5E5_9ACTN|nr:hypothetical protein [Microlunatus kandeliicorticis]MBA8793843.1 hypothetical protein [Microlunatus kandeliicorticis]